ncbi:lipopolysaccharide biosynthesis protein [Agromyces sp. PvR057]|uniref:lipopolysaccharide biosynthesis protein n=1 Tax=Agromyces sp. PvR057 TaxID=3156403 RepID=UPI0033999080
MTDELLHRGARGGGLTIVVQGVKIFLQLLSVMVLSRLLTPEDFGLIAMVAVVLALGDLLRSFGMPVAALQSKSLSAQQASNLFWVNVVLGTLAAAAIALATPLLIGLYDEPRLAAITPALALVLVINGVQVQVGVQLARDQRFVALNATDIVSLVIGFVIAVILASSGFGYWALVAQALAVPFSLFVLRTVIARWVPRRPRRGYGTAEIVRSGAHIGAAQLLTFAASNVDTVLIGAQWGASSLGYYNRAFQLLSAPVGRLLGPLTQVVVPSFSQSDLRLQTMYSALLRVQFLLGAAGIWLFTTAAAIAVPLVHLALGPQWTASAPIFAILAVAGCFNFLSYVSYWVFLITQQARQLLLYNLVTKPICIALVVVASFQGVEAVAWAYSIGLAMSWPVNIFWLKWTAGLPARPFLISGIRLLAAGAVGFLLASALSNAVAIENDILEVAGGTVVASIGFVGVIVALPEGRRQLKEAIVFVCRLIRSQGQNG